MPQGVARGEGLLLVTGEGVLTFPLLRDEITIGRAPECEVVIENSAFSRRHARLCLAPELTIEDLSSRNGTRVRGQRLEPGRRLALAVGEAFQIGQFHFVVARARSNAALGTASERAASLRVTDPTPAAASSFVRELAASALSILVLGETGVGKEVLAQTIHDLSNRRGAFVRANCAAMAPSLIESELFGHEKSAFTGASERRVGLLEAAQGGTFFLDEVGDLPEAIQVKLLRAIEAREITRVGAVTPIALDVRFVAATNRDLAAEVEAGRFRRDLFYRLDGVTLVIPPLREHRERIGPLALQFLASAKAGAPQALDAELFARLVAHDWPGNVRELKAVLERAVVLAGGGSVTVRHVAITAMTKPSATAEAASPDANERQRIVDALEACAGNQTRAAKMLGISRATLVTKLGIHRIQRPRK
ncbi:MAG: sigma 54-interacting transcriptional regulator [Deltaproteobacteria bacterium]